MLRIADLAAGQPGALPGLLALWQQVMPADAPDLDRFRDLVLHNPAIRPEGLTLLWRGTRLAGFSCAVAEPARPGAGARRTGWIMGLGVAAGDRRAGHGTRLLSASLSYLRAAGCTAAELGGYGERYLLPGVDPEAYPAFRALVERAGFRRAGATVAMARPLAAAEPAAPPGHPCRPPAAADLPELLSVIAEFSPDWAGLVGSHLARTGPGRGPPSLLAAFGPGGIDGFAGWDMCPGCPGRFGPMGVRPDARGGGLGAALLSASLAAMTAAGHRRAWFLWGPEGEAGRRMYAAAGFEVSRHFEFFRRELP